jgi:hypothetical protein
MEEHSGALRHPRDRIIKIGGYEDVDLLLPDNVTDGPANLSSFGRSYGGRPYQEVDVPALFCIIDTRAEKVHLRLYIVAMDGTHNGVPFPIRQSHAMNRRISLFQSQAAAAGG